jgi:hypothetical protein
VVKEEFREYLYNYLSQAKRPTRHS